MLLTRLHQEALKQSHDIPSAGHQGTAKMLARLQQQVYWVGMAKGVQVYCQQHTTCRQAKLPNPVWASMCNNTPIGKPWEMLAADIFKVPVSHKLISCYGLFYQVGRGHTTPGPNCRIGNSGDHQDM